MGLTLALAVLLGWVALLFVIAFYGDARAHRLDRTPRSRVWLYVFGLGVYCTSWTFYGAVGDAARNGWDYLPIYLGPALVFLIGFPIVRRLVRLGREHNTGSIADFLSARYGKSAAVGALAAAGLLLAVIPYIALQLKSAASTLSLMVEGNTPDAVWSIGAAIAFAAFAILFGQRKADVAVGNRGLVLAVATESLIKLLAMVAVGVFACVVWTQIPASVRKSAIEESAFMAGGFDVRFVVITVLAGLAALTLPRQFHMMVVETRKPEDARLSRWAFPAYLAVVALVAPPVAFVGATMLGEADPDSYVLALPLAMGAEGLAMLAFIGGFSAAAGMVTISALAMSTMLVNDLAAPVLLKSRLNAETGLASNFLTWRRVAVVGLVGAALIFQLGMDRSVGLAGIGLVAFAGAAQLAPALLFGLFWRRANRAGALAGMGTGLFLWFSLILVPTYTGQLPPSPMGVDAFAFASAVCLIANTVIFIVAVAFSSTGLVDQMQADAFTGHASRHSPDTHGARVSDLQSVLIRVLGEVEAEATLAELSKTVGRSLKPNDTPTPALISLAEARLARSLGAASARILMTRVLTGARVSPGDVVTLIDETAEKLRTSHDRLEESERSIRFYTDNLPALLSYADRDYRLRFANKGYLDFFDINESAVGEPMAAFMTAEEYELRRPHMEAALNGDRQVFDISRRKGERRRRSWQVVYQPRIENDEVVGFFAVYQDNTARREAEEGLRRAFETLEARVDERTAALKAESEARLDLARDLETARRTAEAATQSKTRFLAAASHDLLQPLSAARLFAGALEEDLKEGSEGQAKLARRIEHSIDHADRLLRALLDISRLDADGVTPRQSVFSLGELIEETAAQFIPKAEAKGLKLRIVPCRLAVFSDRGLMTSVLQNLISNAVRYTRSGTVLVGARRQGDTVRLQVIDTGPGIPVERQRAVFKEFERGAMADQTDRGLGLGLAVVDRICTTLGHKLSLQSVEGQGSTFEVTLPRAASEPLARRSTRRRSEKLDGLKVLCLEDEAPVLNAMLALLKRWGCDARGARDEASARAAFSDGTPDVVVLDYQLEDGATGPAVYGELCEMWGAKPPGVLITAERGQEPQAAAHKAKLELIQKPAPPAVLRATLNTLKRKAG